MAKEAVKKEEAQTQEGGEKKVAKKKTRRAVSKGTVHINATFNNTIVTITDCCRQFYCLVFCW
jgi:ribosomal protein S11